MRKLFITLLLLAFTCLSCGNPNQVCGVCGLDVGTPYSIQLNVTPGNTCPGEMLNGNCIMAGIAPPSGCVELPNCKSWNYYVMKTEPVNTDKK